LFYVSVDIGMLVVGGLLGRWYGERPGWPQAARIVVGAWLVFGLLVYMLLGAGLFGQALSAGPIWHGLSLLVVFGVYGVALVEIHAALARRAGGVPDGSRRTLLRNMGATLVGTVVLGSGWRLLSGGFEFGGSAPPVVAGPRPAVVPNAPPFDLKDLSSEITPTSDFYTVSKNFIDPSVAANGWRLKIDGLVDRPMELTYEQLTALPSSEGDYTLMCISNEVGGELWGNAHWRGVKLHTLLEQAGVHTNAVKAVFSAADDYKDSVRLDRALHPDTFLAWEMNGEPLRREHGFPARLLIPGIYGMKNVKWLSGITIVDSNFLGFWQNQGWDDAAPYQTASRIDTPFSRAAVSAGPLAVGGVAFAGDRGIQSVEVSTDMGRTWQPAQVKPALAPNTWQLWRADIQVDHAVREIRVRAVDGLGHVQIREEAPPFPSGSTGYHAITIAVS
jgi:DMSO/TMAO reductase YedYZ molybdopterin-dependent catalytic subunit